MSRATVAIVVFSILVFSSWSNTAIADQSSAGVAAAEAKAPDRTAGWFEWPALAMGDADTQPTKPGAASEQKGDAVSDGRPPDDGMPWLVPWLDYRGDLCTRPALTGDWCGTRQQLMDKGIRFDMKLSQVYQGVVGGGLRERGRYQGGLDLTLQVDTGKAGLWPGGLLRVKGEARYGRASNLDTGALMPVNFDSLYPVPGEDTLQLVEFNYTQFLAPWLGITLGRFSPRETNVFSGDETEQFLNTAFNINPAYATTLPQTFLGAGFILIPHKDVMLTTLVLDSEGRADECGFDTVFDGGTSLYQQLQVTVRPCGLPGHQRVGWTWSDKSRVRLGQDLQGLFLDWVQFRLGRGDQPTLERSSSDCSFFYDFDQYVYLVPGSEDRGIGVFGRFGVTSGRVNPVRSFYSIGVGGKGLCPGRENDSFGVAYYYLDVTEKLSRIVQNRVGDEQGVEIYYNIAVTPWLRITPDIQVVCPVRDVADTAVVAGVRVVMSF